MHIERFGNDPVQGIEFGECYIFPKIDGTNSSVWCAGGFMVCAGSRQRQLTLEDDNAGFYKWVLEKNKLFQDYFKGNPTHRLFGEWLVPHTLKTYRKDAWRKFYVFDVYDDVKERYLSYEEYRLILDQHSISYIPPLCIINNANYDNLLKEIKNNTFLIEEGLGSGEGIVIKNYNWKNKFDNVIWAKLTTNEFKEKHANEMGVPIKESKKMVEESICDYFVTEELIEKVYAKIVNEMKGWNNKYIPRLLSTVFYDLINEEIWNAIKKFKNPTINFKTLNMLVVMRIKEVKPELF